MTKLASSLPWPRSPPVAHPDEKDKAHKHKSEDKEKAREAPRPPDLNDPALYINRQLSWLAFNERVLERGPARALAAARAGQVPGDLLLEPGRVLHDPRLGPARAARGRGGRDQRRRAEPARPAHPHRPDRPPPGWTPPPGCSPTSCCRPWPSERIHIRDWKSLPAETKKLARQYYRRSVFPVLTPLAVDPGHPFPFLSNLSLSLAVEARDPETKERKFARVKVPESLPRFVHAGQPGRRQRPAPAPRRRHELLPLEQLIAANLDDLFPGMEILGCLPVPRHARHGPRDLRRRPQDLLSIVDREVRRRRFGACVRLEVDAGIPERIRRLLMEKLEIDDEDVYESPGPLGLARADVAGRAAPARAARPAVRARGCRPSCATRADLFAAIRQAGHPAAPPLRLVHPGAGFPAPGRRGPPGAGHQDDPLPRRLQRRSGAGPDPRGRERQAGRGLDRAQGALRRGEQHRLGPRAGARRRPRVLRRRRAEDPRQGGAGGAARGQGAAAATCTSAPATTTPAPPACTPTSGCSPPTGRSARTSSELFNALSGFSQEVALPQAGGGPAPAWPRPSWPRSTQQAERARGGPAGAHLRQDELAGRHAGHPGALPGLAGRRPHRSVRARHLLPAPGRAGRVGEHPGASRSWAASSSTSGSSSSGPRARRSSSCPRPTGCRATSTAGSRCCSRSSRRSCASRSARR